MALFEELSQSFSFVEVEPYGQVLVVPSKAFRHEWLGQFEREGVKVYSGAHSSQACFFLKATDKVQTVHAAESEPSKPLSLENASRRNPAVFVRLLSLQSMMLQAGLGPFCGSFHTWRIVGAS